METEDFRPGQIIFVDSNFSERYDCFGVVINKDFWVEAAKNEGVLGEYLSQFDPLHYVSFRVLGRRSFAQYWLRNDPDNSEVDPHVFVNYHFQHSRYVKPVDLRSIAEIVGRTSRHGGDLLVTDDYPREALREAQIVYEYLDGKRCQDCQNDYMSPEDKLLKILEQAVPMENQ